MLTLCDRYVYREKFIYWWFETRIINKKVISYGPFLSQKNWGSISPLVYVVKSKCWHCLIQIFLKKKSSIDDLSLFLQLLGPVPKNQLGGGHICLTIFGGYQKNKIWIWKSIWFGTFCHKNLKKVAVNFHTTINYPISSFLNFTPFCWGATFLKSYFLYATPDGLSEKPIRL